MRTCCLDRNNNASGRVTTNNDSSFCSLEPELLIFWLAVRYNARFMSNPLFKNKWDTSPVPMVLMGLRHLSVTPNQLIAETCTTTYAAWGECGYPSRSNMNGRNENIFGVAAAARLWVSSSSTTAALRRTTSIEATDNKTDAHKHTHGIYCMSKAESKCFPPTLFISC